MEKISNGFIYRYVDSTGRGIMSDYYYSELPMSIWKKMTWLPKLPKRYIGNNVSFFTEVGNSKFIKENYNDFKKYIFDVKLIKIRIKDISKVVYRDKYQIVGDRIMDKKITICKFCGGKAEWGDRKTGYSEMTDRGRIRRSWTERYEKCLEPGCGREVTSGSKDHTEKDISYHSNEERRVYRL